MQHPCTDFWINSVGLGIQKGNSMLRNVSAGARPAAAVEF